MKKDKKLIYILIIVLILICIVEGVIILNNSKKGDNNKDMAVGASEGYITDKEICKQDEYEKTLFGQPISKERNGEMRLGIKCTHDSYAELTIYEAKDGKYVSIFSCTAMIGKNGPVKHAEGDTKTPLGTWTIGEAYGIKDNPGSILPYTKITDDMYWCATGNNGKKYGRTVKSSQDNKGRITENTAVMCPLWYSDFFVIQNTRG